METLPDFKIFNFPAFGMNDFFPLLIALLFVAVAFVSAMNNGVVKLLSSGAAAAAALLVFFILIHLLPALAEQFMDIGLSWKPLVGVASLAAAIVYVIARLISGAVFKWLFNRDGFLGEFAEGIPGGVISFLPSMVVVFFIFCCVRIAGTVQELNYAASLSQPGIAQRGGNIPAYPFSAGWRNGIESVPMVAPVLDLIDPFSNRGNRNTAALVIAHGSAGLKGFAENQKETADLIVNPGIETLRSNPEVHEAVTKQDRMGLVLNADLREFASTPGLNDNLAAMDLKRVLEDFVKSLELAPVVVPKI